MLARAGFDATQRGKYSKPETLEVVVSYDVVIMKKSTIFKQYCSPSLFLKVQQMSTTYRYGYLSNFICCL